MKRNYLITGVLIIGVVLIAVVASRKGDSQGGAIQQPSIVSSTASSTDETGNTTSTVADATSTQSTPSGIKSAPAAPPSLSATQKYIDALRLYKTSGYYFQFLNCHGSPGTLTLKKGTWFMLDNRDKVSRKIMVDRQTYRIAGYNYAIATAPSKPGTYYITCDGGGAASISVQP